ncbi:MAG: Uma2 family endonuclease [Selenomonadaceae bacterium]|nr:Uma2 family endonuclease [Selenomonadaceae bacterium]MBR1858706.1 Uma2 family endonuclease [Selenomonadaceae bacterium]
MNDLAYNYDLADEPDYEIIDGQTYMMAKPSTNHMQISGNIFNVFKNYLKGKRCRPFFEVDVFLSDDDNVIPDVMIVCNPEIIKKRGIFGTPDLIVEIVSPSTVRFDRFEKFAAYEKYGVKEYWIVNPASKSVEVYLLKEGKLILDEIYNIYPDYELDRLNERQKSLIKREIKVSLYDDFYVKLDDIFEYID